MNAFISGSFNSILIYLLSHFFISLFFLDFGSFGPPYCETAKPMSSTCQAETEQPPHPSSFLSTLRGLSAIERPHRCWWRTRNNLLRTQSSKFRNLSWDDGVMVWDILSTFETWRGPTSGTFYVHTWLHSTRKNSSFLIGLIFCVSCLFACQHKAQQLLLFVSVGRGGYSSLQFSIACPSLWLFG